MPKEGMASPAIETAPPNPPSRQTTLNDLDLASVGGKFPFENSSRAIVASASDPFTPALTTADADEEDPLRGIGRPPTPPVHADEEELQRPLPPPVSASVASLQPVISLSADTLKSYDAALNNPSKVEIWKTKVKAYHLDVNGQSKDKLQGDSRFAHLQAKRNEKKSHPCDQCGRVFSSRSELRHHARRYDKRPYACDECDRSFLYPKDLRRHKTTHTGSKGYPCRLCTKSFSRKDNLRRHIQHEHGMTNVPLSPDIVPLDLPSRAKSSRSEASDQRVEKNAEPAPMSLVRDAASLNRTSAEAMALALSLGVSANPPDRPSLLPDQDAKSDASTAGDDNDLKQIEEVDESNTVAQDERQFLICPWRRWKPLIYRKCNGKFKDHAKVIHHLKQSHKVFFHATCVHRFDTKEDLEVHLDKEACCRSCRRFFGSRDLKDKHIMQEHNSRAGQEPKLDHATLWQQIYSLACDDGLVHNPYWGPDFENVEEEAKKRYPYEYFSRTSKAQQPSRAPSEKSIETDGLGSEVAGPDKPKQQPNGHSKKSSRTMSTKDPKSSFALDPALIAASAVAVEKQMTDAAVRATAANL